LSLQHFAPLWQHDDLPAFFFLFFPPSPKETPVTSNAAVASKNIFFIRLIFFDQCKYKRKRGKEIVEAVKI
jgi:hypothetical protein